MVWVMDGLLLRGIVLITELLIGIIIGLELTWVYQLYRNKHVRNTHKLHVSPISISPDMCIKVDKRSVKE